MEGSIYSICPNGGDLKRLTLDGHDNMRPAWSPDGSKIAYLSRRKDTSQLYLMDPDGSNVRQITFGPNLRAANLFWMADSNRIAMLINSENGEQRWHAIDVNTGEINPLSEWRDEDFFQNAVFTHDGTQMAYITWTEHGEGIRSTATIHIQNIDGSGAYRLISDVWTSNKLFWSPDDSQIAFFLDLVDSNEQTPVEYAKFVLYIVNVDGSNLRPITEEIFDRSDEFVWSPDGKSFIINNLLYPRGELYYESSIGETWPNESLYILDINSGAMMLLYTTYYPSFIWGFSWQP